MKKKIDLTHMSISDFAKLVKEKKPDSITLGHRTVTYNISANDDIRLYEGSSIYASASIYKNVPIFNFKPCIFNYKQSLKIGIYK